MGVFCSKDSKEMAYEKKGSGNKNNEKLGGFKGFFNPLITDSIKSAVKALSQEDADSLGRLEEISQLGLKFSVVSDDACTHYTFSLFDRRAKSDSKGFVLSIKHSSVGRGIALLHFLVFEIYEGKGWGPWINNEVDIDW